LLLAEMRGVRCLKKKRQQNLKINLPQRQEAQRDQSQQDMAIGSKRADAPIFEQSLKNNMG
jgi:hypothetical protein